MLKYLYYLFKVIGGEKMKFINNNKIKRILAILCVLVLLFSFSGCKKSNNTSSEPVSNDAAFFEDATTTMSGDNSSTTSESDKNSGTTTQNNSSTQTQSSITSSQTTQSSGQQKPQSNSSKRRQWYTRDFKLTTQELNTALTQQYTKPKNVILMIGDGMGVNDIEMLKKLNFKVADIGVIIDKLPNKGFCTTNNIEGTITDSAAAATALATGTKTINGTLGLDKSGKTLQNLSEMARANNKKVGMVTTDNFTGATPSGFTIHAVSRHNTDDIVKAYMDFIPDVLIGDGLSKYDNVVNNINDYFLIQEEKLTVAKEFNAFEIAMNDRRDRPFFGFTEFDLDTDTTKLAQCTEMALNRLENENGFFLMVESCGPDRGGSANNLKQKLVGVSALNNAVAVALKYCINNPDTVLIVTADHETGGVVIPNDLSMQSNVFTTNEHTATNVGVFAVGQGTEMFNGKTVDNTDIFKFISGIVKK